MACIIRAAFELQRRCTRSKLGPRLETSSSEIPRRIAGPLYRRRSAMILILVRGPKWRNLNVLYVPDLNSRVLPFSANFEFASGDSLYCQIADGRDQSFLSIKNCCDCAKAICEGNGRLVRLPCCAPNSNLGAIFGRDYRA